MKNPKKPTKTQENPETFEGLEPDPIIVDPQKEPELSEAEEKLLKLDRILGSLSPGWKVDITRKQPGWAKGYLETIDVGEGFQQIDMRYLADTWGGDILNLTVKDEKGRYVSSVDVPLMSYPTKRWGKVIYNPQKEESAPPVSSAPAGVSFDALLGLIEKIYKTVPTSSPATDLPIGELFKILLTKSLAPPPPPVQAPPPVSGVQQLLETANALKSLKGLFNESESAGSADGDIFSQINGLLESYAKIKGAEPKAIGPISNPGGGAGPGGAPGVVAGPGPVGGLDVAQIGAALQTMPPKQIAESMLGIVGALPEKERTAVFEGIFELLGIDPQGDEDEPDEDEDEDEDEPDDRR